MNILGLNKTTLLDYPGHVAATIFLGGCNFRCPFCHNRDIVFQSKSVTPLSRQDILSFLYKRRNVLEGVCITGGEPTLNMELAPFLSDIKDLGYTVKLDTNGTNPDMVADLMERGLIDYLAMDVKNSPEKYQVTCGYATDTEFDIAPIKETVALLKTQDKIPYEFRTTVACGLHTLYDMEEIAVWLDGAQAYFIQPYVESPQVISPVYAAPTPEELESYLAVCQVHIPNAKLRGI